MVRDDEASARRSTLSHWSRRPGMVKKRCSQCRYWFAGAHSAVAVPVSPERSSEMISASM